MLYEDHLQIKQKIGGKASATLRYSQITDVRYEREEKTVEKQPTFLGVFAKVLFYDWLYGENGVLVRKLENIEDSKKNEKRMKKEVDFYFTICYTSSSGESERICFKDTRLYKGKKLAKKLMELCNIPDTTEAEKIKKDDTVKDTTIEL